MPRYQIAANGRNYEVESPTPLSEAEAYSYATGGGQPRALSAPSVGRARYRGFVEGAAQGARELAGGFAAPFKMLGGLAKEVGGAIPEVAGHLRDTDTRAAALRGLSEGVGEGVAGLKEMVTSPREAYRAISGDPGEGSFSTRIGNVLGTAALGYGLAKAPGLTKAGFRRVGQGRTPATTIALKATPEPITRSERIPYRTEDIARGRRVTRPSVVPQQDYGQPVNRVAAPPTPLSESLAMAGARPGQLPFTEAAQSVGAQIDVPTFRAPVAASVADVAESAAAAAAAPVPQTPLGQLFGTRPRLSAASIPEGGFKSDAELNVALREWDKGRGSFGTEFGSDPAEIARAERLHRDLAIMDDEYRRLTEFGPEDVPQVSGGGSAPVSPPGREGFRLPEARVPDAQYEAFRKVLGIEPSPDELLERRVQNVGRAEGERRASDVGRQIEAVRDPRHPSLGDESGFINPRLAATVGLGAGGAAIGGAAAEDDPLLGALAGGATGASLAFLPALLRAAAPAVQQARITGALSGLAVPKSVLGNIGAPVTAAIERGEMAPLREFLRPQTARDWYQALTRAPEVGLAGEGLEQAGRHRVAATMARFDPFRRLIGAGDVATQQALERAGLSVEEAQRLLLTSPNPFGHGRFAETMASPAGRAAFMFQRTPANQFTEGMSRLSELVGLRDATARSRALTAGSIGAGTIAGEEGDVPTAGLLAALLGVRGLPFLLGAAATGGPRFARGLTPTPDVSIADLVHPLRPIVEPAAFRTWLK